jgi:PAS domain S-box-containing protein
MASSYALVWSFVVPPWGPICPDSDREIRVTIDELERERATPVLLADGDGVVTHVNDAFCRAYGWRADELVGHPLATIIPPSFRDAHHLGFARFLATRTPTLLGRAIELSVLTRDGREVPAEHLIVGEERDGGWIFGASMRPLVPRAAADDPMRARDA